MNQPRPHLEFDSFGYRIENAPYERLAKVMTKMGVMDTQFKILLNEGFGLLVFPRSNPTIYFSVTKPQMDAIAQDIRGQEFETEGEREDAVLGLKLGTTLAIALTEKSARDYLLAKIAQHNAND